MAVRSPHLPSRSNSTPVVFTTSFFCKVARILPFSVPFSSLASYSSAASMMDPSRELVRPSRKSADT